MDMGIAATDMAIAGVTMDGLCTGTDIRVMDMVMGTGCPMAADIAAGRPFGADSPVVDSMVEAVVDSTVVAVDSMVADTGNRFQS